jgi:hypothetical protein
MLFHEDAIGFPWCGLLIDMSNLSVMADYPRYDGHGEYFLLVRVMIDFQYSTF